MTETTEQIHARWERERQEQEALDAWSEQTLVKVSYYIVGVVVICIAAFLMLLAIGLLVLVSEEYGLPGIVAYLGVIWLLIGSKSVGRGIVNGAWRKHRDRC